MARLVGWKCDGPDCPETSDQEAVPVGWIKVQPVIDVEHVRNGTDGLTLCSNYCMMKLGKARYDAGVEDGTEARRNQRGRKIESPRNGS